MNNIKTKLNDDKNGENKIIWVTLPYLGHIGDKMKKENVAKQKSFIYCLKCPSCNENYIPKADCNLVTRLYKHGLRDDHLSAL